MSGGSTLRAELLQHLMDEGQATARTLMTLTGYTKPAVMNALLALRQSGVCLRTKARNELGYAEALFSLTPSGIDAALAAAQAPQGGKP